MKKKIAKVLPVLIFLLVWVWLLPTSPVLAAVRCETQYGGEVCVEIDLVLDKKVWDPEDGRFEDNLGVDDYRFGPGEEITFQLKIKNVGDERLEEVDVRDYLPDYFDYVSGDLSFTIYDLDVDETETREIKVKVLPEEELPQEMTIICDENTRNKAEAWSEGAHDEDTSQVCIEKKVLGVVKELPPTGPQWGPAILSFSFLSGLIGLFLVKFKKS